MLRLYHQRQWYHCRPLSPKHLSGLSHPADWDLIHSVVMNKVIVVNIEHPSQMPPLNNIVVQWPPVPTKMPKQSLNRVSTPLFRETILGSYPKLRKILRYERKSKASLKVLEGKVSHNFSSQPRHNPVVLAWESHIFIQMSKTRVMRSLQPFTMNFMTKCSVIQFLESFKSVKGSIQQLTVGKGRLMFVSNWVPKNIYR